MPGPAAAAIAVSAIQQTLLQRLAQRQTAPQRLVRRVHILLALAANPCIDAAARQLGLTRLSIRLWRDRWLQAADALRRAEQEQASESRLLDLIEQVLADAPRPGCPATFRPEQIVGIVAVACEPPSESGRPISHWTARELADEAGKRQIVKHISPRTVGRFLKRGRVATAPEPLLAQQRPG
jgi:putative transposase